MKILGSMTKRVATVVFPAIGLIASVGIARANNVTCSDPAMAKNLRAYGSHCVSAPPEPHQLTKREVKHLIATAKSPADHIVIARYYETHADALEAQAASYEGAAADAHDHPAVKNMGSPTMAAHYEYMAKNYREEAKSDRAIAMAQEQMAK